nr:uncharacterized protein c7orf50 like [Quercus suber]
MATGISAGQHVPAWKRLGLKLKYANDTPSEIVTQSTVQAEEPTIANKYTVKRSRNPEDDLEPSKRSKVSVEHEASTAVSGIESSHDATPLASPKGRRKSVTFTSDTKKDDGFSATTLYQNWLANENEAQSSAPANEEGHVTTVQRLEPVLSRPDKKPKKDKSKSKTDKSAKLARSEKQPENEETPDYVKYLIQFYQDKSSWKFHKKKQNELIKHCFDLGRIPAEHTLALVEYVKGLQSAGVQQRLIETSEKLLQDLLTSQEKGSEIENMESPQARKSAYEAAVRRQIERVESLGGAKSEYEAETLADMEREAASKQRAWAILEVSLLNFLGRPAPTTRPSISSTTSVVVPPQDGVQQTPYQNMISRAAPKRTTFADDGDDSNAPTSQQPETSAKRRKTRKSRTNVADDASSSSSSEEDRSSDSDSDSGSSSDDDGPNRSAKSRAQSSSKKVALKSKPIFDKELLDAAFPGSKAQDQPARTLAERYAASDGNHQISGLPLMRRFSIGSRTGAYCFTAAQR